MTTTNTLNRVDGYLAQASQDDKDLLARQDTYSHRHAWAVV